MDCYVADGYWESGYTEQDVCGIAPPRPRGDDAFRTSGQRERFWRERAEEQLEDLLDRAEEAVSAPIEARREVSEAFALVEWERLPQAPKTREILEAINAPQPDYTAIAALILAQRQQIETERRIRRRRRDESALMALMGWQ